MGTIRIHEVHSRTDRRTYLSLMRQPYAGNPYSNGPDTGVLEALLRGRSQLGRRSEWRALIAEDEGESVACLTAILHQGFMERFGYKVGTIGFFEAVRGHDLAVDELFREAERWLGSRDATRIWGPMNGNMLYGYGCLDDRFGERPMPGTAYNPPEYAGHWWRQNYRHAPSCYSYRVDLTRTETRAAVDRMVADARLEETPRIVIREADLSAWKREVEIFIDVYNEAFGGDWGEAPLTHAEMWELLGEARRVVDPRLFYVAEVESRPVGFVFCLPEPEPAGGRDPRTSIRALLSFFRRRSSPRRGALLVLAVLERARRRGLAKKLTALAANRMIERGMTEMEYCLVREDNVASQRVARHFAGEVTKTYRVFEKMLR